MSDFTAWQPKHLPETKRAMDDWGKVAMVSGAYQAARLYQPLATQAIQAQLDYARRETQLAAKHGVDLGFIEEAWQRELEEAGADLLACFADSFGSSRIERITAVQDAVRKAPKTMRYNKRVKRQHGRAKTKKRHGARRGVRS